MGNAASGTLTLEPTTGALGSVTVSIPALTDTLVNLTGTQTLSGKTLTNPNINGASIDATTVGITQANANNSTQLATTAFAYGVLSALATGYTKLPNGLIIQWGNVTGIGAGGSGTLTFPLTFPNNIFSCIATAIAGSGTGSTSVSVGTPTTSNVVLNNNSSNGGTTIYCIAIGN